MASGSDKPKEKPEQKGEVGRPAPVDEFVVETVFPDAAAIFTSRARPLHEAKETAIIVLDTNALLVPYGIGSQTLSQIEATYTRLLTANRLRIPAQVAREFARNRATKLSELFQKLSRRRSSLSKFNQGNYPMLEALDEYKRLRRLEEQMDALLGEYTASISALVDRVKTWEWDDPVSLLYGRLFSADVVVDTARKRDQIQKDHLHRFLHKIPPGYKDGSKDDHGVGDFLIWLTILELGAAHKSSVVFVSGEEKADWFYRSEGQSLYPRFELVDEFRRASGGASFHIIKFSDLLQLFGASRDVVAEVRKEERTAAPIVPLTSHSAVTARALDAERAVALWFMENGYEVVAASSHEMRDGGYDYLVSKGKDVLCIQVKYARTRLSVFHKLEHRASLYAERLPDTPLVLVLVLEKDELLDDAERALTRFAFPGRAIVGTLTPEGRFRVAKEF